MLMKTEVGSASIARTFHALSDETRVEIVRRLTEGEHCVCELQGALGAGQSRLSFHLKVLKTAGLVTDRREGRWVYYALDPQALEAMAELLESLKPMPGGRSVASECCE